MKRNLLLIGLAAISVFAVSCSREQLNTKDDQNPEQESGRTFSLFASAQQVRTVNDGVNTYWVKDDGISVFHAPAGTTNYSSNDCFIINPECLDPEKENYGCFEGTLSEGLAESNDWYLLYPYNEYLENPAGTSTTVNCLTVIGSDAGVPQVQNGNDNTEHLAEADMPLYGKVSNVASGTTPVVVMNQAAAVVKIVVTNANPEPLTVQSVQFTANEEIAGMFAIGIAGETPTYTKSSTSSKHVSNTALLSVENGAELAQNESASFYLAIKPFVAEKGSTLKVTVNGYEKDLQMPEGNDVTFAAGNIKQIKFNYNPSAAKEYELVTSLDGIIEGEYVIVNGGFLLPNAEATSSPVALPVDGIATIEDNVLKTNSEAIVWKFEGTNSAMAVRSYADEANYLYVGSTSSNSGIRISSDGSDDTWEFAENGDGFSMKNNGRFCAKYSGGTDWRSYNSATHTNYADGGQLKLYKKASTDPTIKANDVTGVPATGGEQHTTYQIKNIATDDVAATCDGTVVTSATASEGDVTFTVAPNYTLEDVTTGSITLTSASTDATVTISVSQDASVFEVTAPDEICLANTEGATGSFTIKSTFGGTISIDDETNFTVDKTYDASDNGQERIVLTNGAGDPSADRTATITIKRQGLDDVTIGVKQYKSGNMPLNAPEQLTVTKHNANDGVSVTWTCSDNNVSSYDWIISTENTAAAAEGDANAVKGTVAEMTFTSEASNFSVNTTYYLYVRSAAKPGFNPSEYVTETFTIDPKQDNAFDFSAQGYANQQVVASVDLDENISATFSKGAGSNDPKYYTSGSAVRAYTGNTITVGQKNETKTIINSLIIKKIVITFGENDGTRSIAVNTGSYKESNGSGVWTGDASSVTFSIGSDGKDNRRIKTISVEYTGGIPPVFVESVSLDETELELSEGGNATLVATVLPEDAKNKRVAWSSSKEDVATVDSDGKVVAIAPGNATITVTTEDGGKTATCAVTVKEATKYAITIADGITGGTIESSHAQAAAGTEVTLTITPDTDNKLDELTVDGEKVTVTGNEYKFNMPAHAVTVSASFKNATLTTMDDIFAAATTAGSTATDARVQFDNWVVSGVKNNNAYLTDNNGKGLIIFESGHGFTVGDKLSGTVDCKVLLYNGAAELKSLTSTTTGLTVTKGGTITPASIAIADLSGVNTGAVVSFSGLSYTGSGDVFSDGNDNIKAYNTFMTLPSFSTTKKYNLTGVYIQYNATKEIAPRTSDDIQPEEVPYIIATPGKTSGISADGETISVTVETNVTTGWTVESTDDTNFKIIEKTDDGFKVEVSENTDTENGREATITLKAEGAEDYSFKLTQTEAGSTKSWKKVTDASTLKAGDKLLIVATVSGSSTATNNGTFAANGTISSNIMGKVSVTISNNEITDKNGAQEFILGGASGSWTLSNGEKLLGASDKKKVAWDDGTTTWSISISSGNATIQNGNSEYGKIMYNRDSSRFTTYTSSASASMALPMIFRYE